ncbi:MAG: efflux RND transporter periplasmic adaptor subunit, partial [Bacteroidales bacterium]|nr:efflux RND transporter periplasmic adaptor subunit [Bacteroidales bacterium]
AHGEIVLSPEQAAAAGVKTQQIVAGPFATAIRTSGKITADSGTEMVMVARTSGILSWNGRTPSLGQYVSKGKSIGSVSAESMTGGDAATSYRIAYEAALNKYERAKALREQQIISENQFIEAEAQYKSALNAYQATVSQDAKGGASLDAPMSGYISELFKREGEYVAAGEAIATLNSIASVRLVADLPERYIALRNRISSANFRLSYSEETFNTSDLNGRMIGVGTSVSDNSAYLPVTFEMNNAGSQMVPGSYAEVWLITEERHNVLSVPESALTEEQGQFFIYQKLDAECYKKLPVKLGERNGKNVEIISGIHGGEEIVTEGAFQVKISAASVIPGHTHNH